MIIRDVFRRSDPVLWGSALLLVVISLVLLGTGSDSANLGYFMRQGVAAGLGILVMFIIARTHYTFARSFSSVLFVVLIFLLLIVLQARIIRGAASWLVFGGFHLQPGELAKAILVVVLAKILGESKQGVALTRVLFRTILYAGIPIILVILQPDFGTAMLLTAIWFGMIAVAGLTRKQFLSLAVIAVVVFASGWVFFLKPYQKDRVLVFLNPGSDPLGRGYTVLQSVTAFGSGGFWGRGLGYGPQSRLNFLPENRTDFIFARIGEELGLVGVLGVLSLYGVILWRTLVAASKTTDSFGRAIAVGAFVALLSGIVVNAGMNIGLLPVTGVPLPFISYGGSSLLTMFIIIGLVESVIIHGEAWEVDDTSDVTTLSLGG
ncbi:MAG: rod shape-determining protein RodA [bacterium]|nr:rod shape-determining protein RodA [bacterium]